MAAAPDHAVMWRPTPERVAASRLTRFMAEAGAAAGRRFEDFHALYDWSVAEPAAFWTALWDFCGVRAARRGEVALERPHAMPGARWFPEARLNFAENLLRYRDERPALVYRGEDGARRELSYRVLHEQVARLAAALANAGVGRGDRVAGFMPNVPETIVAMLATASRGAIWSSCSPDFGINGVLDRFGQIAPKVLFTADGYRYAGKGLDSIGAVAQVLQRLDSVERVVVVPFPRARGERAADRPAPGSLPGSVPWDDFLDAGGEVPALEFAQLPFDHPLYIMYSSGTTGVPKCIVHGAGGTLLQHLKEHQLHTDIGRGDVLFYFTTCGWMMWNWLASGLASGATLALYEGSPFHPDPGVLWRLAEEEGVTVFGTSAKYLAALEKAGARPGRTHDLGRLRAVLSTGSPLVEESFDYVYREIKDDLQLSSISGGTDIISCFALGCPILPVRRGELQTRGLGMDVAVFDDDGQAVTGRKGELVCRAPFPSMPVGFWDDVDGRRYHAAYFERFPGIWCHGDYAELTGHGGMIIYGRSDAVLNPGGVRIGTAEIYRQVEKLDEVVESLAIGQDWRGDVRIVLFVRLRPDTTLDAELEQRIRRTIRDNTSPRHVPAKIVAVVDIPRTISGKIVELAVRDVVHGRPVRNTDALANPEALAYFRDRPELAAD
jgi:acetoacetyl-CoA synthetase